MRLGTIVPFLCGVLSGLAQAAPAERRSQSAAKAEAVIARFEKYRKAN